MTTVESSRVNVTVAFPSTVVPPGQVAHIIIAASAETGVSMLTA
jgi:hypothetical protein